MSKSDTNQSSQGRLGKAVTAPVDTGAVSHHSTGLPAGFSPLGVPELDAERLRVFEQCGPEVLRRLDIYRPLWNDEDLAIYDSVLAPVIEMFCIKALAIGIDRAFEQLRYGAGFILDAYKRRGLTDLDLMFAPEHIHWWVFEAPANKAKSAAWRKSATAYLHTTGRIVSPKAVWPVRSPKVSRQQTSLPYNEADEQCYVDVALAKQGKRGPRLRFAIGASFGAGLDGRDIPRTSVEDLVDLGSGRIGIQVEGHRARLTVVTKRYTDLILQAADEVGEGRFLAGSLRVTGLRRQGIEMSDAWHGLVVKGPLGRVNPARARNTWLARHLAAGTPIHYLVQMAGGGVRPIMDLLPYVELLDEQAAYMKALSV